MTQNEADDLVYSTYLRAFARIASGVTGGFTPSDLSVSGDSKVTLALVLGILDAKSTPPALAKRADLLARILDNVKTA